MNVLVFNCGSSSLTYKVFQRKTMHDGEVLIHGKAHRVGVKGTHPSFIEHYFGTELSKDTIPIGSHKEASSLVMDFIQSRQVKIDLIGHRFVHGGSHFVKSVLIDERTRNKLRLCLPLAPIHNPITMDVIEESKRVFPSVSQYATFDTAFHKTLPDYAYTYALPGNIRKMFAFRKFGFHGLSYSYVVGAAAEYLAHPAEELKIVACHLGTGGSSVAAIKNGCSIDTSMGYSPLTGLVMSTRSGDIDPMLAIYLMSVYGYHSDGLERLLNKMSGLLGVSGVSSDIRDLVHVDEEGNEGDKQSELALQMYIHRLKKYVGSYIFALKGMDVLIFTDDIGVQNWLVREKVCEGLNWCGLILDREGNRNAPTDRIARLDAKGSQVRILSIPTDEEIVIYREGIKLLE